MQSAVCFVNKVLLEITIAMHLPMAAFVHLPLAWCCEWLRQRLMPQTFPIRTFTEEVC